MAIKERNHAIARLFWRRLGMLLLACTVIFAGFAVWGVYKKERESRELRTRAEAQLADLQNQERSLSARTESLKTEKGKEAALREQYGVARPGEEVIVIVRAERSEAVRATSTVRAWVRKFVPFW